MTGTTARDGKRVAGGGWRRVCRALGPGLITGAADEDPSGIATYSQAGAQLGYALNWTILLTFPLTAAVQEISARIGRTTGKGIAGNIREHYPGWLLQPIVLLLVIANTINIGADVGAMGNAAALLAGGPQLVYVVGFGVVCTTLEITMPYGRYAAVLKWLTLALFAYFGTLMGAVGGGRDRPRPADVFLAGLVLDDGTRNIRHYDQSLSVFLAGVSGGRGDRGDRGAQTPCRQTEAGPRCDKSH